MIARKYLSVGMLCLAAAGCSQTTAQAPPQAAAAPTTATVKLVRPEKATLTRAIEQPGQIEAMEVTPIFARVPGYVAKIPVDIGDRVKKGTVLAELDVPELVEEEKQKEALLAQAKAEVAQSESAFKAAEANIGTSQALVQQAASARARAEAEYQRWHSEFGRLEGLVARKVIDAQTRDETRNQLQAATAAREEVEAKVRSAEAALLESQAKRDKAASDVHAAQARQRVAEADLRRATVMVQFAKLTAPFDGVITLRQADTGHFVQPASAASKAEPLFVMARMDPVQIIVEVPETDASLVTKDADVSIRVQALGSAETVSGKVARTAWALHPRTHTLRTEIDVPNPTGRLRPGMYAYAAIRVQRADVLSLPASAVIVKGETAHCFQVVDGKAAVLPVRVGWRDSARVEVIPGGAFKGTEEIIASAAGLTSGQPLQVAP